MVEHIENKSLSLFKTVKLLACAIEKIKKAIITNIAYKKQKWLDKRAANQVIGITTSYKK